MLQRLLIAGIFAAFGLSGGLGGLLLAQGPLSAIRAAQQVATTAAERRAEAQRKTDEQLEKLLKMPSAQREKVLSAMPPARRQRIEARLTELEQMDPDDRARLNRRLQSFQEKPPEERQRLRDLAARLNATPQPRRKFLRQELQHLRAMTPEQRRARLEAPIFKREFSPDEQQLLETLSGVTLAGDNASQ